MQLNVAVEMSSSKVMREVLPTPCPSSSLLLSSLELSDTTIYEPEYDPSSEPLHVPALFFGK